MTFYPSYVKLNQSMYDLFDQINKVQPLAERMRPAVLSDFVGQQHIVAADSLLSRAIKADKVGSCIFWGPPGTGKTTLANIIANSTGSSFAKLNAVASGVADAKKIIDEAAKNLQMYGKRTYLLLDECHRWNKAQSDCVLSAIEGGVINFIGSTTENPYVAMTPAIISRCRVFEFRPLDGDDIRRSLKKAVASSKGLAGMNVVLLDDALEHFVNFCGGDLRNALNALEMAAVSSTANSAGQIIIDKTTAAQSSQATPLSIDTDAYYDSISAFCKSMRGSDGEAALYWFFRLLDAGCDPMLLARRIVVHASEDVGLADSNALVLAVSALDALKNIGIPEARIPLAHAILYICNAPKSNKVIVEMGKAQEYVAKYPHFQVPSHLRDGHYKHSSDEVKAEYKYPHDYGGYIEQEYLPKELIEIKRKEKGDGKQ